mmetsp:Transcript_4663/g.11121  ORF Transcript_4663/g.11121 Transcript_4663/m.11121 type:complete len:189 (+) Transcript_4663:1-567(+)
MQSAGARLWSSAVASGAAPTRWAASRAPTAAGVAQRCVRAAGASAQSQYSATSAASLFGAAAAAGRPSSSPPASRAMSYFSGSHYDKYHMVGAKNPDLPEDEQLADAACQVFGTAATSNPHQRSIRKLLMKPLKGQVVVDWGADFMRHNHHGYQDPHRLRAEEKLRRLKMQGRGPPKKGQGKRAAKRK